jgi:signal transduction histidine kinase
MFRATDLRRFLLARRIYVFDAVVALVLVFLAAPIAKPTGTAAADRALAVWWIFSTMIVAGLLIQHRWPVPALLLACIGAAAHHLALDPHSPRVEFPTLLDLAVPITLYTLASRTRSRRISMAALLAVVVAELAISFINPMIFSGAAQASAAEKMADAAEPTTAEQPPGSPKEIAPPPNPQNEGEPSPKPRNTVEPPPESLFGFSDLQNKAVKPGLSVLLALALAFALGDSNRNRRAHLRTLQQRATDLEREHHQRVALATAAERARISRELHDVTAHSLSVIVAQAQAAIAAQRRHPERTTQAMHEVITIGRDSLSEMRRLVSVFKPTPDPDHNLTPPPGFTPPPGITALPALVNRVRAAGTPVHLTIDGQPENLPAAADLTAYRIVQEALTNTLKHAGPDAHATVHLTIHPEHIDVQVTDNGAGLPAQPPTNHGNGLRGIAERVNLLGGKLTVEPTPNGGLTLRAQLPTPPTRPTAPEQIPTPA